MGKWESLQVAEIGFLITKTKLTKFDAIEVLRQTCGRYGVEVVMDSFQGVLKISVRHF